MKKTDIVISAFLALSAAVSIGWAEDSTGALDSLKLGTRVAADIAKVSVSSPQAYKLQNNSGPVFQEYVCLTYKDETKPSQNTPDCNWPHSLQNTRIARRSSDETVVDSWLTGDNAKQCLCGAMKAKEYMAIVFPSAAPVSATFPEYVCLGFKDKTIQDCDAGSVAYGNAIPVQRSSDEAVVDSWLIGDNAKDCSCGAIKTSEYLCITGAAGGNNGRKLH